MAKLKKQLLMEKWKHFRKYKRKCSKS